MKSVDLSTELELEESVVHDLLLRGRYWEVYKSFETIGNGTRFWDNRFEDSEDPYLIECIERDKKTGKRRWPHWMILTYGVFLRYPRGKMEADGKPNREIIFDELPTVDPRVQRNLRRVQRKLFRTRDVS